MTRISWSVGVICGISAETAGIWTPAPAERTASVAKISHGSVYPASMTRAARAWSAMAASATITSRLRL